MAHVDAALLSFAHGVATIPTIIKYDYQVASRRILQKEVIVSIFLIWRYKSQRERKPLKY
jgi:hypothetical protein